MGVIEHVECPFVTADIGKRAAVGPEHAAMLRVLDRRLLEHGDGLRALAVGAQRLGIIDRRFGIVRISAVAHGPHLRRARPIRFPADGADPDRRLCWLRRLATDESEGKGSRERYRSELPDQSETGCADHYTSVGPRNAVPAIRR